jgi:hypothetical protein
MIKARSVAAAVVAAGVLSGLCGAAFAAAAPSPAAPPGPPPGSGSQEGAPPEMTAPVHRLTSVEVMRSTHGPELDIIRVRGLASTGGWEEAELIPLTRGVPTDGILELVLVARAPAEAVEAKGFEPIEAILTLESKHPYKGVTVRSATDSLSLGAMPGYVEAKGSAEDCAKCVGKLFAAKGSGKSGADVVREEDLPPGSRVIKATDGIPTADSNPNRLTLVLGKDGRINTAIWD